MGDGALKLCEAHPLYCTSCSCVRKGPSVPGADRKERRLLHLLCTFVVGFISAMLWLALSFMFPTLCLVCGLLFLVEQ